MICALCCRVFEGILMTVMAPAATDPPEVWTGGCPSSLHLGNIQTRRLQPHATHPLETLTWIHLHWAYLHNSHYQLQNQVESKSSLQHIGLVAAAHSQRRHDYVHHYPALRPLSARITTAVQYTPYWPPGYRGRESFMYPLSKSAAKP